MASEAGVCEVGSTTATAATMAFEASATGGRDRRLAEHRLVELPGHTAFGDGRQLQGEAGEVGHRVAGEAAQGLFEDALLES